uniref:RING-type domain-containing protein n=1 Tax=Anabas testudineus TaxID=64144 RepID=A0A3Q1HNE3_ANATE
MAAVCPFTATTMASLEEELTCSVCRDIFSKAHPLPCGHSFCPTCIREAWSGHGGGARFTCPQCQEEHGEVLCDCCPPDAEEEELPLAVKTCGAAWHRPAGPGEEAGGGPEGDHQEGETANH